MMNVYKFFIGTISFLSLLLVGTVAAERSASETMPPITIGDWEVSTNFKAGPLRYEVILVAKNRTNPKSKIESTVYRRWYKPLLERDAQEVYPQDMYADGMTVSVIAEDDWHYKYDLSLKKWVSRRNERSEIYRFLRKYRQAILREKFSKMPEFYSEQFQTMNPELIKSKNFYVLKSSERTRRQWTIFSRWSSINLKRTGRAAFEIQIKNNGEEHSPPLPTLRVLRLIRQNDHWVIDELDRDTPEPTPAPENSSPEN